MPRRLGWLLLIYAAALAYALVAWMPEAVRTYNDLASSNPMLAKGYLGLVVAGGLVLLGISAAILVRMWRNSATKRRDHQRRARNPSELSAVERKAELDRNIQGSRAYADDAVEDAQLREQLKKSLADLQQKYEGRKLEIVAFGTISSGKSTLLNALAGRELFATDVVGGTTTRRSEVPWPGADGVTLVDTPGLAEVRGQDRAAQAAAAAKNADLVLLVVDGPLRSFEADLVAVLQAMEKRLLICLNKEDWYAPAEQQQLVEQIAEQLPSVEVQDVVAVRAASVERERVRVLPDGSEQAETTVEPPDVRPLANRMLKVVKKDGGDLLLANLLLQSRGLIDDAKAQVRAQLDKRADEIITRYMWAAGGAAGINPLPLLDIAGGSAITLKMVLDLARVYRQPLDIDMAAKILEQLSKNLIAMLGTTAATPAVASMIGSMLKTVPGVGTIAGGLVQGVVQALVTRWIGNVFVTYLRNEMKPPEGGLAELARDEWQQLTSPAALRQLVHLGRKHLGQESRRD